MKREANRVDSRISRRGLVTGLTASGMATALWTGLGPGASPLPAALGPSPGTKPTTVLLDVTEETAVARSGPFQALGAMPGGRIGVCLIVAGATQGAGPLTLINDVGRADLSLSSVGVLDPDPGVERAVYRMLGSLDTLRPVELFGLSGEVADEGVQAGDLVQITWEIGVRGGSVATAQLSRYLDAFHAVVMGTLASNATFTGHLSYVEVSRQE